ncbi:hypothetical protein FDECE_18136 [Fusarium decemcellulare]|nr:hypothetical protein FDECE_18136 [Fusarium decemcellulare]
MTKTLAINRFTGIETRSSIGTEDHPLVNGAKAPLISDLNKVFFSDGIPLAVAAARKAIAEAGLKVSEITHLVSTTCTDSSNPGFDHYVSRTLKGLASRRRLQWWTGRPSNGCKPGSRLLGFEQASSNTMSRTRNQHTTSAEPIYELLGWTQKLIPDTDQDLGFDIDPHGWKVNLSQRVPELTSSAIPSTYQDLLATVPPISACSSAQDLDWAMHPGGASILAGVERVLGISPEHMRASYDRYIHHGNSSSASIFSVLDRLRQSEMDELAPGGRVRDHVVAWTLLEELFSEASIPPLSCQHERCDAPAVHSIDVDPRSSEEQVSHHIPVMVDSIHQRRGFIFANVVWVRTPFQEQRCDFVVPKDYRNA